MTPAALEAASTIVAAFTQGWIAGLVLVAFLLIIGRR